MVVLFWDASALAKRYVPELGSDTVDALFDTASTVQMVLSAIGYAEVFSILVRGLNRGTLDRVDFQIAAASIQAELIDNSDFVLLAVSDEMFYRGIALIERHNLNATDAALLVLFKSYIDAVACGADVRYVLVASDQRLVRAAITEGFSTLNPETVKPSEVNAYLSSL